MSAGRQNTARPMPGRRVAMMFGLRRSWLLRRPIPGDPVVSIRGVRGIYVGPVPGPAGDDGWGIFRVAGRELRAPHLTRYLP